MSAAIEISAHELDSVAVAVDAAAIDEASGGAVWLHSQGGQRRWTVAAVTGEVIEVDGEPVATGEDLTVALSPRVVRFARAASWAPTATLQVLEGGTVLVERGGCSVAIDSPCHPAPRPEPIEAVCEFANAEVELDKLFLLLAAARDVPGGVDLATVAAPDLWLGVDDGEVTVHVDWTPSGATRTTYKALGYGDRKAIASIPHRTLYDLLKRTDGEDGATVTIAFDVEGDRVTVDAGTWRVALPAVEAGIGRHHATIDALLADAGITHSWASPTAVVFGDARPVRAELHQTSPETIRVSAIVASNLVSSAELLTELNQATAGLVGVRLWAEPCDGDLVAVVAATDLDCAHLDDLIPTAHRLTRDIDGLGTFLAAITTAVT